MESHDQTSRDRRRISSPADRARCPTGPIHPGSGRGFDWRKLFAPLGAAGAAGGQVRRQAEGLLLLLPKIKVFSTSATMLVSIAAYSLIWGWKFAVGFVPAVSCTRWGT